MIVPVRVAETLRWELVDSGSSSTVAHAMKWTGQSISLAVSEQGVGVIESRAEELEPVTR